MRSLSYPDSSVDKLRGTDRVESLVFMSDGDVDVGDVLMMLPTVSFFLSSTLVRFFFFSFFLSLTSSLSIFTDSSLSTIFGSGFRFTELFTVVSFKIDVVDVVDTLTKERLFCFVLDFLADLMQREYVRIEKYF